MKNLIKELKMFIFLWSTQSLSQLGSAMTSFALTLWLYEKTGSALQTALFSFAGMEMVIYTDLATFIIAFLALLVEIKIPLAESEKRTEKESVLESIKSGLLYLRNNDMVLVLILFLAGVNLVASAFDAVLPAFVLSRENGGETVLGVVTSCAGIAMLAGSLLATLLPAPKNRIRVIYITMLISLGTENFLLSFCRTPVFWCLGQIIGWLLVPVMNANLDVILRSTIPVEMQGRVYSCRNTLQFFTIPIGLYAGGFMVDKVCEPFMGSEKAKGLPEMLFGSGKGSGRLL